MAANDLDLLLQAISASNPDIPYQSPSKQAEVLNALADKVKELQAQQNASMDAIRAAKAREALLQSTRTPTEITGDTVNVLMKTLTATAKGITGAVDVLDAASDPYRQAALDARIGLVDNPEVLKRLAERPVSTPVGEQLGLISTPNKQGVFDKIAESADQQLASQKALEQRQNVASRAADFTQRVKPNIVKDLVNKGYNEKVASLLAEASDIPDAIAARLANPLQLTEEAASVVGSAAVGGLAGSISRKVLVENVTKTLGEKGAKKFFASKAGEKALERVAERAAMGTVVATEGGGAAAQSKETIYKASDDKLKENNPYYAELRNEYSEATAKRIIAAEGSTIAFVTTGLSAGLISKYTGAAKFEGNLFKTDAAKTGSNTIKYVGNRAVVTFGNLTKEGAEEGFHGPTGQLSQNYVEQLLVDPNTDLTKGLGEATGSGITAGVAGAGAITIAKGEAKTIAKETTNLVKSAVNKVKSVSESITNKEAASPENIANTLDTKASNYNPLTALRVVSDPKQIPTTKDAATAYVSTIETHLDEAIKRNSQLAKELIAEKQAGKPYTKAKVKEYEALSKQIDTAENLVKSLATYTPEQKNTEIEEAVKATDTKNLKVFNSIQRNSSKFTVEELEKIKSNTNLTEEQIKQVEALIKIKTSSEVQSDVIQGNRGYVGMNQHMDAIGSAIAGNNQARALRKLSDFKAFVLNHRNKANAIDAIHKGLLAGDDVTQLVADYSATYRRLDRQPLDISKVGAIGKLSKTIKNEAKLLSDGFKYTYDQYSAKFGSTNVPNAVQAPTLPTNTPTTASTPVATAPTVSSTVPQSTVSTPPVVAATTPATQVSATQVTSNINTATTNVVDDVDDDVFSSSNIIRELKRTQRQTPLEDRQTLEEVVIKKIEASDTFDPDEWKKVHALFTTDITDNEVAADYLKSASNVIKEYNLNKDNLAEVAQMVIDGFEEDTTTTVDEPTVESTQVESTPIEPVAVTKTPKESEKKGNAVTKNTDTTKPTSPTNSTNNKQVDNLIKLQQPVAQEHKKSFDNNVDNVVSTITPEKVTTLRETLQGMSNTYDSKTGSEFITKVKQISKDNKVALKYTKAFIEDVLNKVDNNQTVQTTEALNTATTKPTISKTQAAKIRKEKLDKAATSISKGVTSDTKTAEKVKEAILNYFKKSKVPNKTLGKHVADLKQGIYDYLNNTVIEGKRSKAYQAGLDIAATNNVAPPNKLSESLIVGRVNNNAIANLVTTTGRESPLQTIPQLFSKIFETEEFRREMFPSIADTTWSKVNSYLEEFTATFDRIAKLTPTQYRKLRDSFQLLYSESVDSQNIPLSKGLAENTMTALALVGLNYVVTRLNGGVQDYASINKMLGYTEDSIISKAIYERYELLGVPKQALITALGKDALSTLGLKARKDVSQKVQDSLIMSLGSMIFSTLTKMNVLDVNLVPLEQFNKDRNSNGKTKGSKKDIKTTYFNKKTGKTESVNVKLINLSMDVENNIGTTSDDVDTLLEAGKEFIPVINKLLDVDNAPYFPSTEAPDIKTKKRKGSFMNIPPEIVEVRDLHSARPNQINTDMTAILDNMSEDIIAEIFGVVPDLSVVHIDQRKSVNTVNKKTKDDLKNFGLFRSILGSDTVKFFMEHEVWNNIRMGIGNSGINPNASKVHRELVSLVDQEVTLDKNNPQHMHNFFLSLAEAFGVSKADKRDPFKVVEDVKALIESERIKYTMDAIDILRNDIDHEAEDYIHATVKELGGKGASLRALVALHGYLRSTDDFFTTSMFHQVDGVTNGVIIGLMLLGSGIPNITSLLTKGGVFTSENHKRLSDLLEHGMLDLYQTLVTKVSNTLTTQKLTATSSALLELVGPLVSSTGAVSKEGRDLFKNVLMTVSYGAGLGSMLEHMSNHILENTYAKLTKAVLAGDLDKVNAIQKQLEKVLGVKSKIELTLDNALDTKFTDVFGSNFERNLYNAVYETYKDSVESGIETMFGAASDDTTFIGRRTVINKTMNQVANMFEVIYQTEKDKLEAELGRTLSKEEADDLLNKWIDIAPTMPYYHSTNSKDSYLAMEAQRTTDYNQGPFRQEYNESIPEFTTDANGNKSQTNSIQSVSSYPSITEWTDNGVAPTIGNIHGVDGSIMIEVLKNHGILNVFDAGGIPLDKVQEVTLAFNEELFKVISKVDPLQAAADTYIRMFRAYVKYINDNYKIIDMAKFTEVLPIEYIKGKTPDKSIQGRLKYMQRNVAYVQKLAKQNAEQKALLLSRVTSVTQYNNNEEGFDPRTLAQDTQLTEDETIVEFLSNPENYDATGLTETAKQTDFYKENSTKVDGFISRLFGSTADIFDVNTFIPTYEEQVSPDGVHALYERIATKDTVSISDEHKEQLDTVLKDIIIKVVTPFNYKEMEGEPINSGALVGDTVYLGMANSLPTSALDMSAREVYTHELTHLVLATGLDSHSSAAQEVRRMFNIIAPVVKPEDFLPVGITQTSPNYATELQKATETYDYIFRNRTVNPDGTNNYLHEFLTYALTNEQFIKVLNSQKVIQAINDRNLKSVKGTTLLETFLNIFNKVATQLQSTIATMGGLKGLSNGKSLNKNIPSQKLLILANRIAKQQMNAARTVYRGSNMNAADAYLVNLYKRSIVQPITRTLSRVLLNNPNTFVRIASKSVLAVFDYDFTQFNKVIRQVANRMGATHKNVVVGLLTEMNINDPDKQKWSNIINKSKHTIEDVREHTSEMMGKYIIAAFEDKPTEAQEIALTEGFLRTDLSALLNDDSSNIDEVINLFTDEAARRAEITKLQDELNKTKYGTYYITQAGKTAKYLVNEEVSDHLILNSFHIARLSGTTKLPESNVDVIDGLIDKLITLKAIELLPTSTKDTLKELIDKEFLASPNENGITVVLKLHKDFKAEAKARIFDESNYGNIEKGYIHEIFDPKVDFIVAPLSEMNRFKESGYLVQRAVAVDSIMQGIEQRYLYVNPYGGNARWSSGAASLTSMRHKGTSMLAFNGHTDYEASLDQAKQDIAMLKTANRAIIDDLFKGKVRKLSGAVPAPLFAVDGNNGSTVIDYRFMMNKETKDNVLKRNLAISTVFGSMQASIDDKVNSNSINEEVVKLAYEDYQAATPRDLAEYVTISPDSNTPEYREMWALMPESMRQNIRDTFGDSTFIVKKHMLDYILGYRKVSPFKRPDLSEDPAQQFARKTLLEVLGKVFVKVVGIKWSQQGFAVWQEIVALAKSTVVIRFVDTLIGNITSNFWALRGEGVTVAGMTRDTIRAVVLAKEYMRDRNKLFVLKTDLKVKGNKQSILDEIVKVENSMRTNPISELVDSGLYPNIVEDITMLDDSYTFKSRLEILAEPVTNNTPKVLKDIMNLAFMTKTTAIFNFLNDATKLSDFTAKFVLHEHNKKIGMPVNESLEVVKDVFINYNPNTNRYMQFINDMGIWPFTKYLVRIQAIIYRQWSKRPATALVNLLAQKFLLGDLSDITDSLLFVNSNMNFMVNPLDIIDPLITVPLVDVVY